MTEPRFSPDTFSLAKLLTENRLDFESGLGKVRLETSDDGTLRVDILENRTDALILSKTLRPGEDLVCGGGALVFGHVVVDDAAAAIGVLLPAFARERYWYRWLRWDEPAGEEPDQLARIPAYSSSGTPAERAAVPSARSRVASGASSRRASSR